jgi:hypothetical protein
MKTLSRISKKELTFSFISAVQLAAGIVLIAVDNSAGWIFLILSSFWIIISRKTD